MNRKNILIILAATFLTVVIGYTLYFSVGLYMRRSKENSQLENGIATRQASRSEMAMETRQPEENAQSVRETAVSSLSTQTMPSLENGLEMQRPPKSKESVAESQTIQDKSQGLRPSRVEEPESKEFSKTSPRTNRAVIERSAIALGVENREPIGVSQRVSIRQQRIYYWMHVINGQGRRIAVRWIRKGQKTTETHLPVGSNSWRTWAYAALIPSMVGPARAEILDEGGKLLKTLSFEITE